eukprot:scaffold3010_cov76-Isochrysis_galbana.AAC.1
MPGPVWVAAGTAAAAGVAGAAAAAVGAGAARARAGVLARGVAARVQQVEGPVELSGDAMGVLPAEAAPATCLHSAARNGNARSSPPGGTAPTGMHPAGITPGGGGARPLGGDTRVTGDRGAPFLRRNDFRSPVPRR